MERDTVIKDTLIKHGIPVSVVHSGGNVVNVVAETPAGLFDVVAANDGVGTYSNGFTVTDDLFPCDSPEHAWDESQCVAWWEPSAHDHDNVSAFVAQWYDALTLEGHARQCFEDCESFADLLATAHAHGYTRDGRRLNDRGAFLGEDVGLLYIETFITDADTLHTGDDGSGVAWFALGNVDWYILGYPMDDETGSLASWARIAWDSNGFTYLTYHDAYHARIYRDADATEWADYDDDDGNE